MDDPFWGGMTIVVPAADRPVLGPNIARFLLQPVCGTGRVEKHRDGFLVISRPDQVTIQGRVAALPGGSWDGAYTACDEGVTRPTVARSVNPPYTFDMLQSQVRGRVLVDVVVLPGGQVGDALVVVCVGDREADAEALKAAKSWLFKPGTRYGQPVPVILSIEMEFRLSRPFSG